MRIKIVIFFVLTLFTVTGFSQTWKNPHTLDDEWYLYGVGDPYLLKFHGQYYLYCSTKDIEDGVKCWSSRNLVTWNYEGICATDSKTHGAYAPEVIYYGGKFYMYTSPAGNGHYVLRSDSPSGPFEVVTGNLGHSIDGSVFKQDDGSLYFYHAGDDGIHGHSMSSPTAIGPDIVQNAYMNGWTEGPCVIKRNGIYYMIYTGNHVWSYGYRINCASSNTSPVSGWEPDDLQNPLVLNSMGDFIGLGHGSLFCGPDLDSYYITYHNLAGDYGYGPYRRLNFDRIAWNGDKMEVLGPTSFAQQQPDMPDFYDYFEGQEISSEWEMPNGGKWEIQDSSYLCQSVYTDAAETWYKIISTEVTEENYTAEFNAREIASDHTSARFGAVFGYTNENNFGIALFHPSTNQLEINFLVNGSWSTAQYYDLTGVDNYTQWHSIRIEKEGAEYKFYVDGMQKAILTSSLPAGKIGYLSSWTKAAFSFIAFSNKVNGSGIYNVNKPVPGKIDAIYFNDEGEGVSYHEEDETKTGNGLPRSGEVNVVECNRGGYAIESIKTNDWLIYNINAESSALYNLGITYSTQSSVCQVKISVDDEDVSGIINLPVTEGKGKYRTCVINNMSLPVGYHKFKIVVVQGEFDFYSMQFVYANNDSVDETREFTFTLGAGWEYSDGTWYRKENAMYVEGYGKRVLGSSYWRNYTVEIDIELLKNYNAGILLRTNNPALGYANDDPELGTDFLQGYFVGLNNDGIVLGKQNYNWTELEKVNENFSLNKWYHLKAVVNDDNIKVYLDNAESPVINYVDTMSFINGYPGVRACNANALYDNFTVYTDTSLVSEKKTINAINGVRIYPNPAHENVTVYLSDNVQKKIEIINLNGVKVFSTQTESSKVNINLKNIDNGVYLLIIREEGNSYNQKLVVF